MIDVVNINLTFDNIKLFDNLNLSVGDGEVVGIIGRSGSGKSTLLKCISGLIKYDSGSIIFDENLSDGISNNKDFSTNVGLVFQNFNLYNHLTVIENVMAGLVDVKKLDKTTAYKQALELVKFVGLADKLYYLPKQLSGGQQQRVAIARTLAMKPKVVLMDEPTSSLDPLAKGEVETIIKMMAEQKHTMIIVSHEMELIKRVCTRVAFLDNGSFCEFGTPSEIFENPKKDATRRFVRGLRLLKMDVDSVDFDFIGLQTTLSEYAYRIGASGSLLLKMQSVLEELSHVIIVDSGENNKMHVIFEYDSKTESISAVIYSTGSPIDVDDPRFYFQWRIIQKRCENLQIEQVNKNCYTNRIIFELK